jgi:diguanylate cyclase (GGDEF)-like protein
MEYIIQFQMNIFVFAIIVLLYIVVNIRVTVETFSRKLLLILIILTGAAVITEPLTWIFDGKQFYGAFFLEYTTNMLLLLYGPLIAALMLSYVRYYVEKDIKIIYKYWFYMYPAILTSVLLIVNMIYPIYFSVDKTTNVYSAGDYIFVHYITLIIMYIYMVVIGLKQREKVDKKITYMFMIFFLLPFLAMVLQWFHIDILFSWNSIVLGILVVYIFVESSNGEKDFLTNIYNRSSYEKYVNQLLELGKTFNIIFIDLDKFKQINDTFGHLAGDTVLQEFSRIISQIDCDKCFASRLGGDEFMLIIESDKSIDLVIKDIYKQLKATENPLLVDLTFSFGAFTNPTNITVDQIYAFVDKEMYAYKHNNKHLKRRNSDGK